MLWVMYIYKMHSLNYTFFQIPIGFWDTGPKLWQFGDQNTKNHATEKQSAVGKRF